MKENYLALALSKKQTFAITGALLVSSGLGTGLYQATQDTVRLNVDGETKTVATHARNVGVLLEREHITVGKEDIISVPKQTKIENGMTVSVATEKAITIEVGSSIKKVYTNSNTVEGALEDAGYIVRDEDEISLSTNAKIKDGTTIDYEPSFPITIRDGKEEKVVWTTSTTVGDFLENQNITLGKYDKLSKNDSELLSKEAVVTIDRIEKITDVVEESMQYEVVKKKDYTLAEGKTRILSKGQNGILKKEYEVTYVNGSMSKKKLLAKNVVTPSKKQIIAVGAKRSESLPSRSSFSLGKEFIVEATAYTPYCNGCSGTTATGINVRKNPNMKLIAVDPRVIPLGTKVYVEGYGYAVAGDTGGAIKGYKIDLLMPTNERAYDWGRRKVKIRIVN